ncbi:MAG: S8 family serine peptidase, partial [bacterium]
KFKNDNGFGQQITTTSMASFNKLMTLYNITKLERVIRDHQYLRNRKASAYIGSFYFGTFTGSLSPANVAKALSQDASVEYAEPLYFYHIYETPDDPIFSEQTFYNVIKLPQAWDIVKGEQGKVVIAIVDGGTDMDHPDIEANLWVNEDEIPDNGLDDDDNGFVDDVHGWNFANDSNDPTGLSNTPSNADHGTQTAGIACAVTNNNLGVAGASWNATLMPINVSSATVDQRLTGTLSGVLYAALNGADVINMSFGRSEREGGPSRFEQDLLKFVSDSLNVALVAAAGNDRSTEPHYPSAYKNVLSVGATTNGDTLTTFSNYGRTVDIFAPGINIWSTIDGGSYAPREIPFPTPSSGTSFSCPHAVGVAALDKTQHPQWLGIQVLEQIRVTADNIDQQNPVQAGIGLLGSGRVNAFRAVTDTTLPSLRISNVSFTDGNGDGIIQPGETVNVAVSLFNYLAPASNVNLTLATDDQFITVTKANATIPTIAPLTESTSPASFTFNVASNTPSAHPIPFDVDITSGNYQGREYFSLTVLPVFGTTHINNVAVTVTNIGRIGFASPETDPQSGGIGFKFKNGPNLLFEGAIMAGTSQFKLSNAARSRLVGNDIFFDKDFAPTTGGDLKINTPGLFTDQESKAIFNDSNNPGNKLNIQITQETFAKNTPPNDDFILLRYTIENQGSTTLNNFHFGFFFDWDIDADNPDNVNKNSAGYNAKRKLGYVSYLSRYVGMSVLTEDTVSYRAIYNDQNHPSNTSWGLYDGFTDAEKWEAISGGVQFTSATSGDVSHVIATGPHAIEPDRTIQLGFALLAGTGLTDLWANADSAKVLWDGLFTTAIRDEKGPLIPTEFALQQNFPNPFNASTRILYELAQTSEVTLKIFNLMGQEVRNFQFLHQPAGRYSVDWNGQNRAGKPVASGVYLYVLEARPDAGGKKFKQSKKMILLQ